MMAGFKSEWTAGIVGIRKLDQGDSAELGEPVQYTADYVRMAIFAA